MSSSVAPDPLPVPEMLGIMEIFFAMMRLYQSDARSVMQESGRG
jgi:hypothetical protein